MPMNIKLFIFHKSVNSFITNTFSRLKNGQQNCQVSLVLLDKMADVIIKTISSKGENFIPSTEYSVEQMNDYSLFKKFTITP